MKAMNTVPCSARVRRAAAGVGRLNTARAPVRVSCDIHSHAAAGVGAQTAPATYPQCASARREAPHIVISGCWTNEHHAERLGHLVDRARKLAPPLARGRLRQSYDMAAECPLALIIGSAGVPPCMDAQEPRGACVKGSASTATDWGGDAVHLVIYFYMQHVERHGRCTRLQSKKHADDTAQHGNLHVQLGPTAGLWGPSLGGRPWSGHCVSCYIHVHRRPTLERALCVLLYTCAKVADPGAGAVCLVIYMCIGGRPWSGRCVSCYIHVHAAP